MIFSDSISIRIDFESPCQPIGNQGLRIHSIKISISHPRIIPQDKYRRIIRRNQLRRKVNRDLIRSILRSWFLIDFPEFPYYVCRSHDQRRRWGSKDFFGNLSIIIFKTFNFICYGSFLCYQCQKLRLELGRELSLHVFYKLFYLFGLLVFSFVYFLDRSLDLALKRRKLTKSFFKAIKFFLDEVDMLVNHYLKSFKFMALVFVAKHCAIWTYRFFACFTEVHELTIMILTTLSFCFHL